MNVEPFTGESAHVIPPGGKLAARFRRMNILLFAAGFLIMAAVTFFLLNNVIERISVDYAEQYAVSSADALSTHIDRELGIVAIAARSDAVINWMADEDNERTKAIAVEKLVDIVGQLYSYNLYVAFEGSHNNFRIWNDYVTGNILHVGVLRRGDPVDEWYFACVDSDRNYQLSIGIDHELQRKRLWLDHKVENRGVTLGAISTGLEFTHMAGELFSQYESSNMRGIIIDGAGVIQMDSAMMNDYAFLYEDYSPGIDTVISNPDVLSVVRSYLDSEAIGTDEAQGPVIAPISSGSFNIVSVTPIRTTDWHLVILSGGTSLLKTADFMPILSVALFLLLAVAFATSLANYRLIFLPLNKLNASLTSLRESLDGGIVGTERDDELGELSRTIRDLFSKANVDGLTGIYNRRFMENNLEHLTGILSRSNGMLSVLMLDIDFFKRYNDEYGHDQGDECLRQVAQAIANGVTRVSDFTARYGGEEFIAVLINTDEAGTRVVGERLLESIVSLEIPHPDNPASPYVTISIGGTSDKVGYGQTWKDFVQRADKALYMSKRNGRNRFTFIK